MGDGNELPKLRFFKLPTKRIAVQNDEPASKPKCLERGTNDAIVEGQSGQGGLSMELPFFVCFYSGSVILLQDTPPIWWWLPERSGHLKGWQSIQWQGPFSYPIQPTTASCAMITSTPFKPVPLHPASWANRISLRLGQIKIRIQVPSLYRRQWEFALTLRGPSGLQMEETIEYCGTSMPPNSQTELQRTAF